MRIIDNEVIDNFKKRRKCRTTEDLIYNNYDYSDSLEDFIIKQRNIIKKLEEKIKAVMKNDKM